MPLPASPESAGASPDSKGEGSHYRGSSDIRAGVDVAFAVSQDRDAGLVKFACFKNRLAPEFALTLRPELESQHNFAVTDAPGRSDRDDAVARLRELIAGHPGITQGQLIERSGLPQKQAVRLLRENSGREWKAERGEGHSWLYFAIDLPN